MRTASREREQQRNPNFDTLFEDIFSLYGYDLRVEEAADLWRRFEKVMLDGQPTGPLRKPLNQDEALIQRALASFSVEGHSFCNSPRFVSTFRRKVIPYLKTFPSLKIWIAGCGTGEDAYCLGAILREEGAPNFRIYGTDLSELHIHRAKTGNFSAEFLAEFLKAYEDSGGTAKPKDLFILKGGKGRVREPLREGISFYQHHFGSDASFNEFQLILCRNDLRYLETGTRDRAYTILDESLCPFGLLALGARNTIKSSPWPDEYREFDGRAKIYKKVPSGN